MKRQNKPIAAEKALGEKKKGATWKKIVQQRYLLLMVIPFIIWYLIFCYVPMFGLIGAFQDFSIVKGYLRSPFVGLKYFKQFLTGYHFPVLMENTIVLSVMKLIFNFPMPIIFALFLNEVKSVRYKKVIQTVSYLPEFVSWVVIMSIFSRLLSADGGIINNLLMNLGLIDKEITFMTSSKYVRLISVLTSMWKGVGWGSIIYLAAITSVNTELYEAADIDGAGRMQKMWHITIPAIRPTIAIQFILSMGGLLGGNLEQMWLLGNAANLDRAEIIDTYVLKVGLQNLQYSLATAVGLMTSVVSMGLVLLTNFVVKKLGEEGLL